MERKRYPSDISREQFEEIRGLLEGGKHKTCPRQVDLYDILCAILYLLKNACGWRGLPGDFPKVSTVRYYFDQWSGKRKGEESSLLEQALKKSGRARAGRSGAQRADHLLHYRFAKREEHGYSAGERL